MVNPDYRKIIDYTELHDFENKSSDMLYVNSDFSVTYNGGEGGRTGFNPNMSTVELQNDGINEDYQILPKTFFKYDNIPPPLVNKTWLKSVYEENRCNGSPTDEDQTTDESCAEDVVPLSCLKRELMMLNEVGCDTRQRRSIPVIQRKRGRPKKLHESDIIMKNPTNNFFSQEEKHDCLDDPKDADWWTKNFEITNDSGLEVKNELTGDGGNLEALSNNEVNDYFEAAEGDKKVAKRSTGKKTKKKDEIQGIKVENSKVIFPCQECGKTFSAASTLKYHLRIHNGTLIKCRECDRGFTTNYLLKCHMRIHNGDLFMCHKCGRGFTTAELLKVHNRSHTGIRPYVCNICMKAFPSASNLTQHKETHEPEKKYLCFQCGSSFSQKRCLDGHMLSHGEKNHICTVCGKLWARKSDLTEHMRVHTGYKPYACNSCPQKFTQASSLRRHQIVHMDAKPIKCLTCGKMLKCDEYYKRHMKKHVKEGISS